MFTLTAFINGYNKSLASHLAEELKHTKKADVTAELLLGLIKAHKHGATASAKATPKKEEKSPAKKSSAVKPTKSAQKSKKNKKADESSESDGFEAFGKFKTMATLQKAHDKATAESKYVNAKSGSVIQDSTRNRHSHSKEDLVFYDSNVCGVEGSDELKAILKHFPGSLVEEPEATPKKKSPAKKGDSPPQTPSKQPAKASTKTQILEAMNMKQLKALAATHDIKADGKNKAAFVKALSKLTKAVILGDSEPSTPKQSPRKAKEPGAPKKANKPVEEEVAEVEEEVAEVAEEVAEELELDDHSE